MHHKPIYYFFFTTLSILSACSSAKISKDTTKSLQIPFNDGHIQYEGRITQQNNKTQLYWPGTSATIRFSGTGLKATMQDFNGQNYFNVIIDNDKISRVKIDSAKKTYALAEGLSNGVHTVSLIKITQIHKEYKRGYSELFGFEVEGASRVMNPPKLPKRKIEFYGNSITCGHAILDSTGGDRGAPQFENNYLAYGAITARHFNARYRCIAKSGIGVMVSFGDLIMSEMYNRTNPFDSTSVWDFKQYVPDIVVVDLLQNDQGILGRPEYVQYPRRFGTTAPTREFIVKSYQDLIQKIRNQYPNTSIICALGSMDITREGSVWPGYVREAVANLKDAKIYTHFFPYKGTPKHPLIKDHENMAQSLISFIDQNIKW